jgi:hypothetical protein
MGGRPFIDRSEQDANLIERESGLLGDGDSPEALHRLSVKSTLAADRSAGELQQRLAAIAGIGGDSLISRAVDGRRQVLRFRSDPETRRRLTEIVKAEQSCCSFLDLVLAEDGAELVLIIAAPSGAQVVADELADAFTGVPA